MKLNCISNLRIFRQIQFKKTCNLEKFSIVNLIKIMKSNYHNSSSLFNLNFIQKENEKQIESLFNKNVRNHLLHNRLSLSKEERKFVQYTMQWMNEMETLYPNGDQILELQSILSCTTMEARKYIKISRKYLILQRFSTHLVKQKLINYMNELNAIKNDSPSTINTTLLNKKISFTLNNYNYIENMDSKKKLHELIKGFKKWLGSESLLIPTSVLYKLVYNEFIKKKRSSLLEKYKPELDKAVDELFNNPTNPLIKSPISHLCDKFSDIPILRPHLYSYFWNAWRNKTRVVTKNSLSSNEKRELHNYIIDNLEGHFNQKHEKHEKHETSHTDKGNDKYHKEYEQKNEMHNLVHSTHSFHTIDTIHLDYFYDSNHLELIHQLYEQFPKTSRKQIYEFTLQILRKYYNINIPKELVWIESFVRENFVNGIHKPHEICKKLQQFYREQVHSSNIKENTILNVDTNENAKWIQIAQIPYIQLYSWILKILRNQEKKPITEKHRNIVKLQLETYYKQIDSNKCTNSNSSNNSSTTTLCNSSIHITRICDELESILDLSRIQIYKLVHNHWLKMHRKKLSQDEKLVIKKIVAQHLDDTNSSLNRQLNANSLSISQLCDIVQISIPHIPRSQLYNIIYKMVQKKK